MGDPLNIDTEFLVALPLRKEAWVAVGLVHDQCNDHRQTRGSTPTEKHICSGKAAKNSATRPRFQFFFAALPVFEKVLDSVLDPGKATR